MNPFLKTYRLALTPLSPIHIGCGEDFEPTNYVIDDGVLYGFDPSRAALTDVQKGKLMAAANSASLQAIQGFFRDNAKDFKPHADVLISVSDGVAKQYEQKIGRTANLEASGNHVFNNLFIERTSYTGSLRWPYIPGSSFKGAIRTAWLDELNHGNRPQENCSNSTSQLEQRLFKGDFATSPLRLLKVADLMSAPGQEPERRVMYAVNRKKKPSKDGQEQQPKGITARKECLLHGQYRAFLADAVLPSLDPHTDSKTTPAKDLRLTALRQIAKWSNHYNKTRLQREMAVLDGRGFVNPAWKSSIERLLTGRLGESLANGDAFLIRLGRYGGAESKTLTAVANIKIMGARVDGRQQSTFESTTKTVWLAAENEGDQKHLLPFGWAVVEIDPTEDCAELKAWCAAESKRENRPNMTALRQQFEAEKEAAKKRKEVLQQQAQARELAKLAELAAATKREREMVAMTPQAKRVETLRQKCEELDARIVGGNFKKQSPDAGKAGLYQDAVQLAKLALESSDWTAADKAALADMLERWLPKVVGPWDAKEQRKKLKLSALKGLS